MKPPCTVNLKCRVGAYYRVSGVTAIGGRLDTCKRHLPMAIEAVLVASPSEVSVKRLHG